MIVTDQKAASTNDGTEPDAAGHAPRVYQAGSRLRQALDLARRSHRDSDAPASPPQTQALAAEASAVSDAPLKRPGKPGAVAATTSLEPVDDPAPATDRYQDSLRQSSRKPGLGQGLDALLPPNGSSDRLPEETWDTSAQGWVHDDEGRLEWRPIIATVDQLDRWDVATYLGIATGRSTTGSDHPDAIQLARARREAIKSMVADAVRRGAHGVVGVKLTTSAEAAGVTITAVGTAVTLANSS